MLSEVGSVVSGAIERKVFPGAAWAAVAPDSVLECGFLGRHTYEPESDPITESTLFDLASVTKVMATTTSALLLFEQGGFELDQPVRSVLPEFAGEGKHEVTFRHLLQHNSGLPHHRDWWLAGETEEERWRAILEEPLLHPAGQVTAYSCGGFLVLGRALQRVTGEVYPDSWTWPFFRLAQSMGIGARFNPSELDISICAPTEVQSDGQALQGIVHDENCRFLGGMAGNAGLFGSLGDVCRFARWCLQGGEGAVSNETWEDWTRRQPATDPTSTRTLGWDTKSLSGSSAGNCFSARSFGHTGFTGTSVWVDPDSKIAAVLLTNRVYPTRDGLEMLPVRAGVADTIFKNFGSLRGHAES